MLAGTQAPVQLYEALDHFFVVLQQLGSAPGLPAPVLVAKLAVDVGAQPNAHLVPGVPLAVAHRPTCLLDGILGGLAALLSGTGYSKLSVSALVSM